MSAEGAAPMLAALVALAASAAASPDARRDGAAACSRAEALLAGGKSWIDRSPAKLTAAAAAAKACEAGARSLAAPDLSARASIAAGILAHARDEMTAALAAFTAAVEQAGLAR